MYKIIIFSLSILFFSACSIKDTSIQHTIKHNCEFYSLKTAQCENASDLIHNLEPYKVIFIGDHHTEDDLHLRVAQLISDLYKNGVKIILANEWFYPSDKKVLQAFSSNEDNESVFLDKIQWKKRMKFYKYDSFKPMYEAIKKSSGELHGINLSKVQRKNISEQNLLGMDKEENIFYKNLDLNVNPHKSLVMPYLSHCHAPKQNETLEECIQRMYRVQVAWDSKMALESYKLSTKLKSNEKLLVFAEPASALRSISD